jgi:L-asparagine transporter-like permease
LFSYTVIVATHVRFRRQNGCPPNGKCQMWGFPYTSFFVLISLIAAMISMIFVRGQLSGLIAGIGLVVFYSVCYGAIRYFNLRKRSARVMPPERINTGLTEFSQELSNFDPDEDGED